MPELPEVEHARRQLSRVCIGRRVESLESLCETDSAIFCETTRGTSGLNTVVGKQVVDVGRKGKLLWIEMESSPHVLMHFGMSGGFVVKDDPGNKRYKQQKAEADESWPPRFTKMSWTLDDGTQLAYTDVRRFGSVKMYSSAPAQHPSVEQLGFDCLYGIPNSTEFASLIEANLRVSTLKGLLLDQTFSAGVGNWVADDVLYDAGLHPGRAVKTLNLEEIERLRKSLADIVRIAVEADSDSLKYPTHWLFHVRWKRIKSGKTLDGKSIKFDKIAGRTTAFVPLHQKYRKTKADLSTKASSIVDSKVNSPQPQTSGVGRSVPAGPRSKNLPKKRRRSSASVGARAGNDQSRLGGNSGQSGKEGADTATPPKSANVPLPSVTNPNKLRRSSRKRKPIGAT